MYQDIGMVEGVHYIGYDGTFAGLRARVESARMDPERAERISKEGQRFVADRCSPAAALSTYRDCALRMTGAVQSGGNGASEER